MHQTKKGVVRVARPAYAKINLYLDILACREDGYHDLLTVMHSLSLHDDVILTYAPAKERSISLRVYGACLPLDRKNLAYRAAELFLDAAGLVASIRITVRKKLPVAAGLAGGSSDAAAVLLACNEAAGYPLSQKDLLTLAATLGSDVPFCLVGGTQLCRGRGEQMQELSLSTPLYAVIAVGNEHISTPAAFAEADAYYHRFDGSVSHGGDPARLCEALGTGDTAALAESIYNAFEAVILPGCPAACALRDRLLELGAYAAHMSGSGPAVFGLFRDKEQAVMAARVLGGHMATSVR